MRKVRRHRTRWIAVVVLLVLVVLGAFAVTVIQGVSWRDRFPITRALLSDEDTLTLVVNTCGGEPAIDRLREEDETVKVAVTSTRTFGGPGGIDCLDTIEVQLQAPLGERKLVDAPTGDDLVVEAG